MSFADAIESAQRKPESEDGGFDIDGMLRQGASALLNGAGVVPGVPDYSMEYHCARLRIGEEVTGLDERGNPIMSPVDDSDRLKEIMDLELRGKAVRIKKQETFLRDGTVVIWIEWMTLVPKEGGAGMSLEQLLTPRDDSDEDIGASEP